jgi:acyl carrier protein
MTTQEESVTSNSLIDRIREIVRTEGDIDYAAIDENLFDAGLSSFGVVRVAVALEDEFGIELADAEDVYASFTTLQRIEALVEKAQAGGLDSERLALRQPLLWRFSGMPPTAE